MKLSEILFQEEYASAFSAEEVEIEGICTNSKQCLKRKLFICVKGTKFDTHCLLQYVKEENASCALVEEGAVFDAPNNFPIFTVKNTRKMTSVLWSRLCGSPEKALKIIGITGTNGKTSTSFMLHSILVESGIHTGLIGTVGCMMNRSPMLLNLTEDEQSRLETMTTPDPDLLYPILRKMADSGITHVVMEVSSHALYFEKCATIRFEMGIFTNLAYDHLDLHKTKEAYQSAKEKLFLQSKIGIWNVDDPAAEAMIPRTCSTAIRCSAKGIADYYVKNKQMRGCNGISYMLTGKFGRLTIPMQIPGEFTVYNSLLAASAAITLGVSPRYVRKGLSELTGVKGRIEPIDTGNLDFKVYIDYAHTEAALRNLLLTVREFCMRDERIVLVFGCGGDRDKSKRSAMGKCAEELADFSIITTDNHRTEDPKKIIMDILKGFENPQSRKVILNRKKAITYAVMQAQPKDVILVVGKGHEAYEICGQEKIPFDERKIILDAIHLKAQEHTVKENYES